MSDCFCLQRTGYCREFTDIAKKNNSNAAQYCAAFILKNNQGDILLQKRPVKGLLGGMVGFPLSELQKIPPEKATSKKRGDKKRGDKGKSANAKMAR